MNEDVLAVKSAKLCPSEVTVRRCLFDRPDSDTTRQDLERLWTELRQCSGAVWNFNFDTQRPVTGRIVWTRDDGMWVGKISALNAETDCDRSVTSTATASRDRKRHQVDHTAGVMKCSRLTRLRRQSRVTGKTAAGRELSLCSLLDVPSV